MVLQILIGAFLMLTTIAVAGASLWRVELWLRRRHDWLVQAPHGPKLLLLLCAGALWVMGLLTIWVWLWALTFYALGLFPGLEPCVYFALVSFTTLGYGDVLLPHEWRLLGGMTAANGFLNFGILVASLTEALRNVRLAQIARGEAQK
ncbi:ion channel [Frigidibacter sp. SD6-1]|uniref:ion channel n=1 Tax=Frigidibacter sp. SD6-1 TaxID=3032581 RepID=UPI0024E0323C|nr:ion channel [Frigidibacter sp. SD6-1]